MPVFFKMNFKGKNFEKEWIYFRDVRQRRKAARKNWPDQFSKITLLLDGKHTKTEV